MNLNPFIDWVVPPLFTIWFLASEYPEIKKYQGREATSGGTFEFDKFSEIV